MSTPPFDQVREAKWVGTGVSSYSQEPVIDSRKNHQLQQSSEIKTVDEGSESTPVRQAELLNLRPDHSSEVKVIMSNAVGVAYEATGEDLDSRNSLIQDEGQPFYKQAQLNIHDSVSPLQEVKQVSVKLESYQSSEE